MKFGVVLKQIAFASLVLTSSLSFAVENKPEITVDGLYLVRETGFSLVYALPGIEMGQYNRIYLDDAYIAFKKNWQRQQNTNGANRISANDMAKIKIELSLLFRDIFSRTLEENGYVLATEPAEDVLQIKPAIINLDIAAPGTQSEGNVYSFSESAGEMTLYLELYDSVSGDIIAKAIDRQKSRQTGYFQWQNRIINRAATSRILQVWANILKEDLNEVKRVNNVSDLQVLQ